MPTRNREPRFEDLTETTGILLSREGADMMYTRYFLAAELAAGKRVLELGCGAGQGLGMIGRSAVSVVGGDYSMPLLRSGRGHYGSRFPLVRLSAEALPFRDGAFDLVLFFEASYYVSNMEGTFDEVARVTDPGGAVLLVNANPERLDFIRSPHSIHYHTADEFRAALTRRGFEAGVEAAFPVDHLEQGAPGLGTRAAGIARQGLEALGLVPRTLRGRARLKRLIYGRLLAVPPELSTGFGRVQPREEIRPGPASAYKVLFVTGRKPPRA